VDETTQLLFGTFPREVHRWRKVVNNLEELEKEIRSGAKDIAIYDKTLTIDKILLEIDAKSVEEAFVSTCKLIDRANEEKVNYIPVFSGRRGFHIYLLFNPIRPPNIETGRYILEAAQRYFSLGVDNIDKQIVGDIRHLIRIPNTHHERSGCYCTYLPLNFTSWDPSEVVDWAKEPHEISYTFKDNGAELGDYINIIGKPQKESFDLKETVLPQHKIPTDVREMLRGLIRPCLVDEIFGGNPNHRIRTELAIELKLLGYGPDSIVEIISRLGWSNFNRSATEYHVRRICEGDLKPMSNRTLRSVGLKPVWRRYPWRRTKFNH